MAGGEGKPEKVGSDTENLPCLCRNRVIVEALERHLYTQGEIGQHLDKYPAFIWRIVRGWKARC